jgi:hypothetical protein
MIVALRKVNPLEPGWLAGSRMSNFSPQAPVVGNYTCSLAAVINYQTRRKYKEEERKLRYFFQAFSGTIAWKPVKPPIF